MPELPEVEILVRHLHPLLIGSSIENVTVSRPRACRPTARATLKKTLAGATFIGLTRRGKYLVFSLRSANGREFQVLGHLGMTGRMYLLPLEAPLPKHAAIVLGFRRNQFVFEDTRYFGRFTLDITPLAQLGPEPLSDAFSPEYLQLALRRLNQPIKPKMLDQSLVAGIGNIYASEALFLAGISPKVPARKLSPPQIQRLWAAIRETLLKAIHTGSSLILGFAGNDSNGLFYFGSAAGTASADAERFRVYDRAGNPCATCGNKILRLLQAGRSTFYCPACQPNRPKINRPFPKSN